MNSITLFNQDQYTQPHLIFVPLIEILEGFFFRLFVEQVSFYSYNSKLSFIGM